VKPERRKQLKRELTSEKLFRHVNVDAALEAPENEGKTPEEIADAIIDTIAAATPWSVILPGIGLLIDAVEAPIIKAIAHGIILATVKKKRAKATSRPEATRTSAATTSDGQASDAREQAGDAPPPDSAQP
jgi:hypothetical protein